MQGHVLVDDHPIFKPGTPVSSHQTIRVTKHTDQFVCRSGWKLEHARHAFQLHFSGKVVLDAGISTGGFTDCLLQAGARHVYGIDVGHGQVHGSLYQDPRVTILERTNLRYVTALEVPIDMVTLDLSFISILKVMDTVLRVLKPGGELVALIKPQFEAGKHDVPKGGVIRDEAMRQRIVQHVADGIAAYGFSIQGIEPSPTAGAHGNQEYILYAIRDHGEKAVSER